jgi:Mechanosensitive ion channel
LNIGAAPQRRNVASHRRRVRAPPQSCRRRRKLAGLPKTGGFTVDMQSIQTFLSTTVTELAIKVLAAIAFWIIGRWLIGRVISVMQAAMNRNNVDPTLTKYLGSIVAIALNITLVLGILGYFGIQTTSFAAMLAGAGVAIGAAWSGMLGNFAAGAFMLVLRPFKVGDFVSIGGITGTVHELGLFGTLVVTPDSWPAASTRSTRSSASRPQWPRSPTCWPTRRPRSTCWTSTWWVP